MKTFKPLIKFGERIIQEPRISNYSLLITLSTYLQKELDCEIKSTTGNAKSSHIRIHLNNIKRKEVTPDVIETLVNDACKAAGMTSLNEPLGFTYQGTDRYFLHEVYPITGELEIRGELRRSKYPQ